MIERELKKNVDLTSAKQCKSNEILKKYQQSKKKKNKINKTEEKDREPTEETTLTSFLFIADSVFACLKRRYLVF